MAIVYQVKRSETSSSTPGSGDLAVGELALNLTDAKIFSKKSDGTIVSFNTTTETPVFFADEVDLGNLTTATNTYDMSSLDGGSPASGGGIAFTDLSVTTNSAGTAALSYNNSTGVFTYTPPDLSSYLTSYTVTESDVTTHQAALSITESQISDLGTYLTSYTVTESDVTTHQAALSITESQISDLQTYLTSETFTSLVQDTTPQLGGDLDLNSNDITGTGDINITGDITGVDLLRINETGTGLRMTNVGAFDNSSGNFRIFSNGDLILSTNGDSGTAVTFDQTTKDATFSGAITTSGNIEIDGILTQGTDSYYTHQYVLHGTTTDATETEILTTASTRIPVATDTTIFYEVSIVARRTDATGESASWHLKGCVDNFSGTVADVGSVYEIAVAQDDVALSVDVRADDTNNAINVFVTGAASKTIRWTAIVKTTEVAQ